jgi:hypothetical protein
VQNLGWLTFIIVLVLALGQNQRSSFDQQARNAALVTEKKVQHIKDSTKVLRDDQLRDIASMARAVTRTQGEELVLKP